MDTNNNNTLTLSQLNWDCTKIVPSNKLNDYTGDTDCALPTLTYGSGLYLATNGYGDMSFVTTPMETTFQQRAVFTKPVEFLDNAMLSSINITGYSFAIRGINYLPFIEQLPNMHSTIVDLNYKIMQLEDQLIKLNNDNSSK